MIELLSPVGDFECLKSAVQNGADSVYFGANMFSARASAKNFDLDNLELAINYAKIRGVKTNLTLNILIKNNEFKDAFELAKKAYEFGIDAIIVQDLGLASQLIKNFPDLAIHGSTQMSVHNLEGVKKLEKLGFKRVVLSRELSIKEIEYICQNSNIEIECFVHGALCISYSGQCLFSSIVGGRSGNRGRCAQPCRLPYTLLESNQSNNQLEGYYKELSKGYLLSPRDLCGLDYLPRLINAGVACLKIEGRMKNPDYVATVTKTYRKYIDMLLGSSLNSNILNSNMKSDVNNKSNSNNQINNNQIYNIDNEDIHNLMQVFNRGGFSSGHLSDKENTNLIFKEKPNNMGIYLGTVAQFNNNKGYITLKLKNSLAIGDKISISTTKEESTYTVSELMVKDKNLETASPNTTVKIGRMKGNIKVGDKIYKMSSKQLSDLCKISYSGQELRKKSLTCNISIHENVPITISVSDSIGTLVSITSNIVPVKAISSPITKDRIVQQLSKTNNTPYTFGSININLGENLYLPSISSLNELRRQILNKYETFILSSFKKTSNCKYTSNYSNVLNKESSFSKNISFSEYMSSTNKNTSLNIKKIALLLNIINNNFDYDLLCNNINKVYVPLKYFFNSEYKNALLKLAKKAGLYIYMPCIMRDNYTRLFKNNIDTILSNFHVEGFVISNIGQFELLENYKSYNFIANYTMNLYNDETANCLDVATVTISPELSSEDLASLAFGNKSSEMIFYGKTPIMNSNYCLLGNTNKCFNSCDRKCLLESKYFLKDRLGILFRCIPDNIDTVTTIYNSKVTSISTTNTFCNFARIDILDETISEINNIISVVLSGSRFEGKNYTNGNQNRNI